MLDQYELFFYKAFGFRLYHLPWVAIPVFAGSLVVPVLAWQLQRRQFISPAAQRMVEIAWLAASTLLAALGWVIWAVDYCDRIAADRVTPFVYGFYVGIAVVVLSVSGIRRWRVNKCLAVKFLLIALLLVALHVALFYACLMTVVVVGLLFVVGNNTLAAHFLPSWIGQILLGISIVLYLLIALLVGPALLRWLRISVGAGPAR